MIHMYPLPRLLPTAVQDRSESSQAGPDSLVGCSLLLQYLYDDNVF
jgi:hypothetical protein